MLKKILSNFLLIIGVLLVATSCFIFWQEEKLESTAQNASIEALEAVKLQISNIENGEIEKTEEILFDENLYMGILTIPALDLELPIQNSWSYEKLSQTPCLYQSDPMVIAGHNYQAHFAGLVNLKIGDLVTLTSSSGEIEEFYVAFIQTIDENDVEAVTNSTYDLTLFTCNYNNIDERIVVYLTG